MSEIIIRHSEVADIPEIKRIYEGKVASSGTLQLPYSSMQLWQSRLENLPTGFCSLVAEQNSEIIAQVGFEVYQNPRRKHVGSFGMAVKDSHQNQGVGSKLLSEITNLADNWLNLRRIEITVFTDNEAAICLYKKHGFTIEGESPDYAFRNGKYVSVYHMGRVRT
ncbi:GNAT family N-acetyltransferase [Endozoicomonas gorgoniicola]|uniref:GNAT family N-acetyltransferase n=1 Tax=Endozoicomonas gorgoniicola TaxID=1234144 RepID=A0ABT3MRE6_9GAMM|nr:GNAT family N-acetyltransferase [Endozoicomonas gorgoniicola]MCW7551624.1 GNAT family N-acetyltransferase [Endozoicomonas gorgoniicola]